MLQKFFIGLGTIILSIVSDVLFFVGTVAMFMIFGIFATRLFGDTMAPVLDAIGWPLSLEHLSAGLGLATAFLRQIVTHCKRT